jgi:hypothetical protein
MSATDRTVPNLQFVVPAASENRWSDLLASLISTDPGPIAQFVDAEPDLVRREVVVPGQVDRKSDRLDLLLLRDGRRVAAIEVKVLSDLGPRQLARYLEAFPDAATHHVLHLGRLPLSLRAAPQWQSLTWESVLTAYSQSAHPWVAATARAWLTQLDSLVPHVDASTVWNEVPDDAAGFELALRARIVWLAGRMDSWCDLDHELGLSSGGGAWSADMSAAAGSPGHRVIAEIQEGLAARAWRMDPDRPYRSRLDGPVVLVGLRQDGISTSAAFDWRLLHGLFLDRVVDDGGQVLDGRPWQTTNASSRDPIDRQGWQSIVDAGAPKWLGKGWGMAVARSHHQACAFGARFLIPPTKTLGEIDSELQRLQGLITEMAEASIDPEARH